MVEWLIGIVFGLLLAWIALIVVLTVSRPRGALLGEAMRLLPDTVRLLHALATDPVVPRGAKLRLWLLFGYLAMPLDIVPDFIPVVGYADDAIIVGAVLRSTVRRAGLERVRSNWRGSEDGFRTLVRLAGLRQG